MYKATNHRFGLEIMMTQVEQLARFAVQARYEDLSQRARQKLKIRVLDALGGAIGPLDGPPLAMLRTHLHDFGGNPLVTLIGGRNAAPDPPAFYHPPLVRYPY